ncbi:MAG: hypothetical protein ABI193_03000 [Minicystis sp.]
MTRSPRSAAALLLFALAAFAAAACDPLLAKFAGCQTDADCPVPDGGKLVCYNLRCVECHYDADCSEGRVCGSHNSCESLDSRNPDQETAPPPATLEECAKRCKGNSSCGDSCRFLFRDGGPDPAPPPQQ